MTWALAIFASFFFGFGAGALFMRREWKLYMRELREKYGRPSQ